MFAFVLAASAFHCGGPEAQAHPSIHGARDFRPLSELYFLPRGPVPRAAPSGPLVPDSKVEWDVSVATRTLGLGGVQVRVVEQVVYLSGIVPTDEARQVLVQTAQNTHGVVRVEDSLEITP